MLNGLVAMEILRNDASMATFLGVHSGLAMGPIYLCGPQDQNSAGSRKRCGQRRSACSGSPSPMWVPARPEA
jgi:Acyl-CoA dehydrogenase, N-terminal domain